MLSCLALRVGLALEPIPASFLSGTVIGGDAQESCTMESVSRANSRQLGEILQALRRREYFRYVEVDLDSECQFWKEDQGEEFECSGPPADEDDNVGDSSSSLSPFDGGGFSSDPFSDGAVGEEPPPKLCSLAAPDDAPPTPSFSFDLPTDLVVNSAAQATAEDCTDPTSTFFWTDICTDSSADSARLRLVDLLSNPEKNTYYNGSHIWEAIYTENCEWTEQCYEEEVLSRLLSGLHSSTSVAIAKNFHAPSASKNRTAYASNPTHFVKGFNSNPSYLKNLHFTYVVLLRALKKGSGFLLSYDYGSDVDGSKTSALMTRLLDSSLLSDCDSVFNAFDESGMFRGGDAERVKTTFKGVFKNVTKIVDCVACQQCRMHAKVSLLGVGAALKILFLPEGMVEGSISRNEVVALINTVGKISESVSDTEELETEFLRLVAEVEDKVGTCVSAVKSARDAGTITAERELELIKRVVEGDEDVKTVCSAYADDLARMVRTLNYVFPQEGADLPDAVVVGTGLAGLSAALTVLDRGGRVVLVDKEAAIGGNSAKASSGINACCPHNDTWGDSKESFYADTTRSAGDRVRPDLVEVLVDGSEAAVAWLKSRAGVDLSMVAQLGGHSAKRTNRPKNGMAGAEIVYGMGREVKKYEKLGMAEIILGARVTELVTGEDGAVRGVRVDSQGGDERVVEAGTTILATGGFASDRSSNSYLDKHRPELMSMPATAGGFSTGDGISLASKLGATTVDMEKVQLHPTGWVDPADPDSGTKTLAAELMRGVGGLLFNVSGSRFCNEVSTRANVTHNILLHDEVYASTGAWQRGRDIPDIWMVLGQEAGAEAGRHVDLYTHKGLLTEVAGLKGVAKHTGMPEAALKATYRAYAKASKAGVDPYGKTVFRNLPSNLKGGKFYVGKVTPVLHYCMGGLKIDSEGNVMTEGGGAIPGLYAAGEVTGGVHGANRLGGNSLLECTVFGRMVGETTEGHEHQQRGPRQAHQQGQLLGCHPRQRV